MSAAACVLGLLQSPVQVDDALKSSPRKPAKKNIAFAVGTSEALKAS